MLEAETWAMESLLSPTYFIRNLLVRPASLHDLLILVFQPMTVLVLSWVGKGVSSRCKLVMVS